MNRRSFKSTFLPLKEEALVSSVLHTLLLACHSFSKPLPCAALQWLDRRNSFLPLRVLALFSLEITLLEYETKLRFQGSRKSLDKVPTYWTSSESKLLTVGRVPKAGINKMN